MNTVYYAVGGGLGHLTRARRVLEALALTHDATIVTSCGDADVAGAIPTMQVTEGDSIRDVIGSPSRLIVDSFPCGIRGELAQVTASRLDYVARRLRWREYHLESGGLPLFDTTYVVEELEPEHFDWVVAQSAAVVPLELPVVQERAEVGHFWLIVHAGPEEEVRELIAYTRELAMRNGEPPRVLVATRCDVDLPPRFERVRTPLPYASAARIISAAGFNVMLETEPWRDKHHVVPFPRRFDDQFARAARRRRTLAVRPC